MANIFDYLKWRSDVPFSIDPFNEVDNLVLSVLCYTDFEGVIDENTPPMDIKEVREKYFSIHTREEIAQRTFYTSDAPFLLDYLYDSRRYKDLRIGWYVNDVIKETETQFSVTTFYVSDIAYVAFRGTDNSIIGWKEDFNLSYKNGIPGQIEAVDYLNRHFEDNGYRWMIGGHSKGGHLAVYAAAFAREEIRNKIEIIWSNDGPGFLKDVVDSENYQSIKDKVLSYVPEYSIFGLLLNNSFEHHVIKSSAKGNQQHDSLTWLVERNHFETADNISNESLFLENTIERWLETLEDKEKEEFISYIYSLFEATGQKTIEDIKKQKIQAIGNMITTGNMPTKEQMNIISKVVGNLMKSSGSVIIDHLTSFANEQKEKLLNLKK